MFIIGSILINIILGSIYNWGTLSVYIVSYYKLHRNDNLNYEVCSITFPAM